MRTLKEIWNTPVTPKHLVYAGFIMLLIMTPGLIYILWYELVSFTSYWILTVWGGFLGWTIVTYSCRNDFKKPWKKEAQQ